MKNKESGFTILELVIVIIIVGILASLALVRFTRVIESARSVEALTMIKVIRQAVERCYLMRGSLFSCQSLTWSELSMDDPAVTPGNHFDYSYSCSDAPHHVRIVAVRNTYELGVANPGVFSPRQMCGLDEFMASLHFIQFCEQNGSISTYGYGAYGGIK